MLTTPSGRRLRRSPAYVILVTAHLSAFARAAEPDAPDSADSSQQTDAALVEPVLLAGQPYLDGALVVPLDLFRSSDSQFIQRLFLSHGIETDLGIDERFTEGSYHSLLASFNQSGEPSQSTAPASTNLQPELSLVLRIGRQLALSRPLHASDDGVSDWEVTWIETRERLSDQTNTNTGNVGSVNELTRVQDANDAPAKTRAEAMGIDPNFVVDIERAPLPTEGLAVDGVATALLRRSDKIAVTGSGDSEANRRDEFARLRKWLKDRKLEIDLDDDCPFSREDILNIVEYAQAGGDVDVFLDLALPTESNPLVAGVSSEWQVLSFSCLSDSADTLDIPSWVARFNLISSAVCFVSASAFGF